MKEEMEELYAEGVATHGSPDHAGASARARSKRWFGVRAGGASEPRNEYNGVPTLFKLVEGNIAGGVNASRWGTPRGLKNLSMHATFMRENREIPSSPARPIIGRAAQGRLRPQA